MRISDWSSDLCSSDLDRPIATRTSCVGFGVGKSTLNRWVSHYRPSDLVSVPQADLARENERLRLENRVLREEREILKKTTQFFASQKPLDRTREHSGNWACIASPCDRSAGCADESRARTNAAAADGDGRVRDRR